MANVDKITGATSEDDNQIPILNGDVGVIVGTPELLDSGEWRLNILKDGLIYSGKFNCPDALEKCDLVLLTFKDGAGSVRGKVKKVA